MRGTPRTSLYVARTGGNGLGYIKENRVFMNSKTTATCVTLMLEFVLSTCISCRKVDHDKLGRSLPLNMLTISSPLIKVFDGHV